MKPASARHWLESARPSQLTTVARGNLFEERSLTLLQANLSMSLRRVGGKDDGGIDLQGWWWLPPISKAGTAASIIPGDMEGVSRRRRLRVLAQCKAEKKKMGPNYVREMEGVLLRHTQHAVHPTVALLISESNFTKATVLRVLSSPIPFFMIHLPPPEDMKDEREGGDIGSALWNPALGGQGGLLGGEIELRWERALFRAGGRPGLWRQGVRLKSWVPPEDALDEGNA